MSLVSKAFYNGIGRVFSLPRLSVPLILTLGLTLGAVLTVIAISSTLLFQPLQGVANEKELHVYSIELPFNADITIPIFDMKRLAHFNDDYSEVGEWGSISTTEDEISINNTQYDINKNSASNNILKVLGTNLIKGQDVTIESPERFVWISESFWINGFSGSDSALGQTVKLGDKNYTVAGIIEDVSAIHSFGVVNLNQVWQITNLTQIKYVPESDDLGTLSNIIFLPKKQHKTLTSEEIKQWSKNYVEANIAAETIALLKSFNSDLEFVVGTQSYRDNLLGSAASLIVTLMVAVIGLLFMATLNLLNLFIVHYQSRSKEFAIQLSLGASLTKLRLLIFLENVPCFSLAAITGLLSAGWIIKLLPILAGSSLPLLKTITLNLPTLLVAVLIVIALTFIFSLLATIDVNKHCLADNLNSSGKGIQAQSNQTLSKSLMVFQLSLASILLTSSVMLALQSYQAVYGEVGYTLGNSYEITMESIDKEWKDDRTEQPNKNTLSNNDLEVIRFIESTVSGSEVITPSSGPLNRTSRIISYTDDVTNLTMRYRTLYFNERYLPAFNIAFLAGSNLTKAQIDAGDSLGIIDSTAARLMYPKLSYDEIIGKKMKVSDTIIQGIVPALKSHGGNSSGSSLPVIYRAGVSNSEDLTYTVMMPKGKELTTAMLEDKFKNQFPLFKNIEVTSLNDTWAKMTQTHRISLWIIITVTLLTLLLAAIGVAGLTQMTTNHRKYELAVRMATGAKQSLLVRFILKDALWMLVLGLGLGFAFSVFGYEQLQKHLTMLPEFNGVAMSILDLGLIFIVLLSVIIPAWRVISADPMQALREE
jgi:ABC-type antimicrobial peptide transport system permease subunit